MNRQPNQPDTTAVSPEMIERSHRLMALDNQRDSMRTLRRAAWLGMVLAFTVGLLLGRLV